MHKYNNYNLLQNRSCCCCKLRNRCFLSLL